MYTTFGFETIAEDTNRTILAQNIVNWLNTPTGINDSQPDNLIDKFTLEQNYPNPFNPSTRIAYHLPAIQGDKTATLSIYNQLGQVVKTLVNKVQPAGSYEVNWNGRDESGHRVASGIYFYQLRYGDYQSTQKMVLLT